MTKITKYINSLPFYSVDPNYGLDKIFNVFFDDARNDFINSFSKINADKVKYPKTDIVDYNDCIEFEVEVIGFKKENIKLTLDKDVENDPATAKLILEFTKTPDDNKDKKYIWKERKSSSSTRIFDINKNIYDVNKKPEVKLENNILYVKLFKNEKAITSSIELEIK